MKTIVIDDEKAMHLIMKRNLSKFPLIEVVGLFHDTASASLFLDNNEVHMAFVDISMPKESGMQFAQRMAEQHPKLYIVFVTSHKEYALEAFTIQALDYIVKPISLERIGKSVTRALALHGFAGLGLDEKELENQLLIYGFGGMEIRSERIGSVKWPSRKSKELFGYLLLNRGRLVSRTRIIEDLFGEMAQKNADIYLNTTIYQLRKSLEPHGFKSIIKSNRDGYGVEVSDAWIDFIDFEEKTKPFANKKMDASHVRLALEVEECYVDELFCDRAYLWALHEMERLSGIYADFVKKLAVVLLEVQDYGTAVRVLNKLLSHYEFDEEAVRLLLLTYAGQQDKIALTKLFIIYEQTVYEEYGIHPSRELRQLYSKLLQELRVG